MSDILSSQLQGVFNSTGTIKTTNQMTSGDVNPNSASGQFNRNGDLLVYRALKRILR